MKNRLERIFDRIESSDNDKWRDVLRTALLNEINKIDKKDGYSFEIAKANFFYGSDYNINNKLTYK